MKFVLNYCLHDRDLTLKLLCWIGCLGGSKESTLVLQGSQSVLRENAHTELIEEAEKHFGFVESFIPFTEDERGWPYSPNHGWIQSVIHQREGMHKYKVGEAPFWFWLEPDCVPLTPDWVEKLEEEAKKAYAARKPFMGAEVTSPEHRMSGVGLYPPSVLEFLEKKRLGDMHIRRDAFDSYFASEIVPKAFFTKLIQNVHLVSRNPDISPTFPDQTSLTLLDKEAVLFHRCKDGTLIDRLEEKQEKPKCVTVTQAVSPSKEELQLEIQRLKAELEKKTSTPTKGEKKSKKWTPERKAEMAAKMKNKWAERKAMA